MLPTDCCGIFVGNTCIKNILLSEQREATMADEAPSWVDQWDAGGFGAIAGNYETGINKDSTRKHRQGVE